jgi:hypothetical protein
LSGENRRLVILVALGNGKNRKGEMVGFFHNVKNYNIIRTNTCPKKEEEKELITFFYGKLATLGWDLDQWG